MYKILSHTADFKIRFMGKNYSQLIESVMEFYYDNLEGKDVKTHKAEQKIVTIEDEGIEFIIVRLINELIFYKDLSLFVKNYSLLKVSNTFLEIEFKLFKSNAIRFKEELKSATYYNLKLKKEKDLYIVEVVIDI